MAISGASNTAIAAPGIFAPVNFSLTIGAQTYSVTEDFQYTSAGSSGRGQLNLKKQVGRVNDGFLVVSRGSALENEVGTGHYYEFECFLALPGDKPIEVPDTVPGSYIFTFNELDPVVISTSLVKKNGTKLNYDQSDRDLGLIRRFSIDTVTRRMTIRTWDLLERTQDGGTGLPGRGQPFTAFNFTLRLDLDQRDGTKLQAVTATRLTRRTIDDAFWQTGRRKKRQ
jgi:hypothetical protein